MTLILSGEPLSTNHLYKAVSRGRHAGVYMSAQGKARKLSYQKEARAQWKGKPTSEEVELWITIYFGTKRRADIDNYCKVVLDSLTGIVYDDDSQIMYLHIQKDYDPKRPRFEIDVV